MYTKHSIICGQVIISPQNFKAQAALCSIPDPTCTEYEGRKTKNMYAR